jgi:hypothetical protein
VAALFTTMTLQAVPFLKASTSTPAGPPVTRWRTAPGRTYRLKLPRTEYRFVV